MNFFKAQSKAKQKSHWLIFLFLASIISIILIVNILVYIIARDYDISFYNISLAVIIIVLMGSFNIYLQVKKGGEYIAKSLGGVLVLKNTTNFEEKQLINIVDEISIASGIFSPPVYQLPDESINAFVAGHDQNDAVIAITKGAIKNLNRQETAAVIAHEYSHIFNGDMNLNLSATSLIGGIDAIRNVGLWLINSMKYIKNLSSNNRDSFIVPVGMVFFLIGVCMLILGFVGSLFADFMRSLLLKQREFLADATAIKYTRDNIALANALKKIATIGSTLRSNKANLYSHFYFANGLKFNGIFPTHPPIIKRIYNIEPNWDGNFIYKTPINEPIYSTKEQNDDALYALTPLMAFYEKLKPKNITDQNIKIATSLIETLPNQLIAMSQDSFSARGIILAMLASDDNEVFNEQLNELKNTNPKLYSQMNNALSFIKNLDNKSNLSLMQICMPTLKNMSKAQYQAFRMTVMLWIYANSKIVFSEWILMQVIIYPLDLHYGLQNYQQEKYNKFSQIKEEVSYFMSVIIKISGNFDDEISNLNLNLENINEIDFRKLENALLKLKAASKDLREKLLKITFKLLSQKDDVKNEEMLYAISLALDINLIL